MFVLKVPRKDTEKIIQQLISDGVLDKDYYVKSDIRFTYIPLKKKINVEGCSYVKSALSKRKYKNESFKDKLKKVLTKKEMNLVKTSYDVIGEIAILDIEDSLKRKEKKIAEALMNAVPSIKTVLSKIGIHQGKFRTQKLKYVLGKRTKIGCLKENNVDLCLNVEKVYFSVRLASERKRILSLVKPKENVLVMFSGCAPYPCVIARNTKVNHVTGIELNPEGHKYGIKNVEMNHLQDKITLINGDARFAKGKYDRVIMPLPKSAEEFLDSALKVSKKGTMIHMYTFGSDDEMVERKKVVRKICKKNGKNIRIIRTVRCGQFSPRVYRHCIDFRVS